jgi:hypothetical protein
MALDDIKGRAEFVRLREAYELLADIYDMGGVAVRSGKTVKLSSIPRSQWSSINGRTKTHQDLLLQLIDGPGEKKSFADTDEVVLSVVESEGEIRACALVLHGRSKITSSLSFCLSDEGWADKLRGLTDWSKVGSVIAAADGNNQRAGVGMTLSLAGVGHGKLNMTEVEIPQEIDEATHLVRGAEWMKAGLPRFRSAASEALWYAMRLRSVHSRVVRTKKQGLYTSMGLTAMFGSGLSVAQISSLSGIGEGLCEKLIYKSPDPKASDRDNEFVKEFIFDAEDVSTSDHAMNAAMRIWRGPAIFKRGMDWRVSVSQRARKALFEGKDLVEVSESFRIQRRELVRILSVSLEESICERDRFLQCVLKPATIRTTFL